MKQVLLERYGAPAEAVRCVDVPDVGAPAAGEVVFDVLAFPINPADLSMCRGTYRLRPALPAGIGAECVGRVAAVGAGVSHVKPGDRVINLQRENWVQRRGVRTVNVVRRESLFAELTALGADVCVMDGPDVAEAVRAQTGGASIRLGIDAVSGRATARISTCVGEGGVVCNYGSMSGEDPIMPRGKLVGDAQTLVGFILGRALATR